MHRNLGLGLWLILVCCVGGLSCSQSAPPQARFVREIPWIDTGIWLKADTHFHTKFSDGGNDLAAVIAKGVENGCHVLAVTDHADTELQAASDEYFDAIEKVRVRHPDLVLIAGLEWNVPPWKGEEHATLLAPINTFERKLLRDFKTQFDDWQLKEEQRPADMATQALRWLAAQGDRLEDGMPLVIYNHPSRKREDSKSLVPELTAWRKINEVAVGFEGGPGHQEMDPTGDYKKSMKTIDRWDPAVNIGDAWDQLLHSGQDIWGAIATSDFHNAHPTIADDYWPGEFSETWLYAPEKTSRGVFSALRAGSFFGVHGHIAREVELTISAAGLPRPAHVGEVIYVPVGQMVTVQVRAKVPEKDWRGETNKLDEFDIICITPTETKLAFSQAPNERQSAEIKLPVPAGGMVLRARGKRKAENGPSLMFYTNSIRIQTESPKTK